MKITDVTGYVLPTTGPWRTIGKLGAGFFWEHAVVRIVTDEGISGDCITFLMNTAEFESRLPSLRSLLVGRDPHDVEAISYQLTVGLERPNAIASVIDICLWDLLGKYHGEPIYRLLGAARDRIRAYASTLCYETIDEFVDLALECKGQGFTALKLHAYAEPDKDIEVCRAVHAAVGDSMELMHDPVNRYDREGALRVGRVLEELGFTWFEAPIFDSDLLGLAELRQRLSIPICAVESVFGGLRQYPKYLTENLVGALRSVGDLIGGISAMRKSAALCEAFNVKYELHSYGPTLIQAAHLQVMLAIHHCEFIEIPVPLGVFDFGMKDVITVGPDGFVEAPTKPGLGYEIDWDQIEDLAVREF